MYLNLVSNSVVPCVARGPKQGSCRWHTTPLAWCAARAVPRRDATQHGPAGLRVGTHERLLVPARRERHSVGESLAAVPASPGQTPRAHQRRLGCGGAGGGEAAVPGATRGPAGTGEPVAPGRTAHLTRPVAGLGRHVMTPP